MTLLEAPRSVGLVVMLTVCVQAEDGLPALAGGEQEEYHSWPARPGGDRHHKGSNGTLQDADSRRATGNETLRGSEGKRIKDKMQSKKCEIWPRVVRNRSDLGKVCFPRSQNYCWQSLRCAPFKSRHQRTCFLLFISHFIFYIFVPNATGNLKEQFKLYCYGQKDG